MQNKGNALSFLVILGILVSVGLGCKVSKMFTDRFSNTGSNSERTTDGTAPPWQKEGGGETLAGGLKNKSNLYISQCFNKYSLRIGDSHSRYLSWMKDPKTGPTGKESYVYGLYDVSGDGTDCQAAINQAKDMEPSLPEIEGVADRYSASLAKVIGEIRGIYSYYEQEDYKDDKLAKGIAAHPGLIAAFDEFEAINKEFGTEIGKMEDEVSRQSLDELKDKPEHEYEYALVDFRIQAKALMVYVRDTKYDDISADEMQKLIDAADAKLTELKGKQTSDVMSSFTKSNADQFIKASKELMRRVRDKKPFDSFERRNLGTSAGWMVSGSPDQVIDTYNKMLR